MRALLLTVLCGCTVQTTTRVDTVPRAQNHHHAVAQLDGHLDRVDDCIVQLRRRDPRASGLVDVEFRVEPSGDVSRVEVRHNTSGSVFLGNCVSAKIAALQFDPAPPRPISRHEVFRFCEPGSDQLCRLSPLRTRDGERIRGELAQGIRSLESTLVACQEATSPEGEADLSVEISVGPDGRVASGWVRSALGDQALRSCAIAPLLNQQVAEQLPQSTSVRFTIGLRPGQTPSLASR